MRLSKYLAGSAIALATMALTANTARRISIIVSDFLVRRVTVDHRIHVARGNTEVQVWLAQCLEGILRSPVWLRDDADAKTVRLEQPTNNRHAKRRVIDVGIASNNDDVAGVPSQLIHLGTRHRQLRRRAKALGPILVVVVQGGGGFGHRAGPAWGAGIIPTCSHATKNRA